jgi:hypothetical protein
MLKIFDDFYEIWNGEERSIAYLKSPSGYWTVSNSGNRDKSSVRIRRFDPVIYRKV